MPTTQLTTQPSRVVRSGDSPGVIYNRSTTIQVFWGTSASDAARSDASILDLNATIAIDGSEDIWMVAASGSVTVDYMPSASAYFRALTAAFGALAIPSVFSPNFVHLISGWAINEDGSAEFNNLTVRGTFFGTTFIINATGLFFYSGTPALGNLILSITSAAGTDGFGNAVPTAGLYLYNTTGNALLGLIWNTVAGSQPLIALFPDSTFGFTAHSPFIAAAVNNRGLTSEFLQMNIGPGDPTSAQTMIAIYSASPDGTTSIPHMKIFGGLAYNLLVNISPNGIEANHPGAANTVETWQSFGALGSGFSAGSPAPKYKLYADNTVALAGEINATSGTTSGTVFTIPSSPAGYRPISTKKYAVPVSAGVPPTAANPQITVTSAGAIILSAGPTAAAYSFALDVVRYPLDV